MMLERYQPTQGRALLVYRLYEEDAGYGALYGNANHLSPYTPVDPPLLAKVRGFDLVPCLADDAVADFRSRVMDAEGRDRFNTLPSAEMLEVLEALVSDSLHEAITGVLGTDFGFMFGMAETASPVSPDSLPASAKWHVDHGPHRHLKIVVSLDGPETHDGAMAFLDRPTSSLIARTGYFFAETGDRLLDISELAAEAGIPPLAETRLSPPAGTAILFQPAVVLYKDVPPTQGQRRTFTAGVVPMPGGWRKSFTRYETHIRGNVRGAFPHFGLVEG